MAAMGFDYHQDNLYFVTLCVHGEIGCFGNIIVSTDSDLSGNNDNNINGWSRSAS